jgi:hypothetical protein
MGLGGVSVVDEEGIVGLKGSGGSCGWASSGSFTAFRMTAKAKAEAKAEAEAKAKAKTTAKD